jgi:glyoxylase-like metal-dependent hydrolase (beta-lactamase superfamily II)
MLRERGDAQRAWAAALAPGIADQVRAVPLDPPDRLVPRAATLDLGGRHVELRHLGRGHTDNDLVVQVPGSSVLFAGDLVEQGAPPTFEDSFPLEWPATLGHLVDLAEGAVVPGHGDVVDRDFVAGQLADIAAIAEAARRAWPDLPKGRRAAAAPGAAVPPDLARGLSADLGWPPAVVEQALSRALLQIAAGDR